MTSPSEKHIQPKAETLTVEGYNSLFRHFLARLRRKNNATAKAKTCCGIRHADDGSLDCRAGLFLQLTMP